MRSCPSIFPPKLSRPRRSRSASLSATRRPMDALKKPKTHDVVPTDYFLPKEFGQIVAATDKYEYDCPSPHSPTISTSLNLRSLRTTPRRQMLVVDDQSTHGETSSRFRVLRNGNSSTTSQPPASGHPSENSKFAP
jgi:hypothetical protein